MAMYERPEQGNGRREEYSQQYSQQQEMAQRLQQQRQEKEYLARSLQREAMNQWQKAVEGIVALPAALMLGVASSTMYVVTFLARGFEVFQAYSEDMRRTRAEGYQGQGYEAEGRQQGRGGFEARFERQPAGREGQPGWSAGVTGGERAGERAAETGNVTPPTTPRA